MHEEFIAKKKPDAKGRIPSASSKNRESCYDKYNLNESINSHQFDNLYQHDKSKELNELKRLS